MEMNCTKYELFTGRKVDRELVKPLVAGQAFLKDDENFYTVKLMMFLGQTYYMVKNKDSSDRYTVFAKQVKTESGMKFQNPVGSGRLSEELSSFLEIYFPVLRAQLFMSLYPTAS